MSVEKRKICYDVIGQKIIYNKKESYSENLLANTLGIYLLSFKMDQEWSDLDKISVYLNGTGGVTPISLDLTDEKIAIMDSVDARFIDRWLENIKEFSSFLSKGVFYLMTDGMAEWILRTDNGTIEDKFSEIEKIHTQESFQIYVDNIKELQNQTMKHYKID